MYNDTIKRIEARIARAKIPEAKRRELIALLDDLKKEIADIAGTNYDKATNIATLAEASSGVAVSDSPNPELLKMTLDSLDKSVEEFEVTHPALVRMINSLSMMLSNIGI